MILPRVVLMLSACAFALVADPGDVPTFKAGGVALALPGPDSAWTEVGDEYRSVIFELMAPTANRLLSAYMRSDDLATLGVQGQPPNMSRYGLIEVSRKAEYADCGPAEFRQVTESISEKIGQALASSTSKVEEEMNQRLKALDLSEVKVGEVKQLGLFFSKTDAVGMGIFMALQAGATTAHKMVSCGFLRVRNRLIFTYLYSDYKGPESVTALRASGEKWADAILAANR